jgi:hypothetical protein
MDLNMLEGVNVINNAAIVPVIVAVVQLFKMIFTDRFNKFAPFISLGVGILFAFLTQADHMGIGDIILAGILFGLSASGLYSSTKHTAHAVKGTNSEIE